MMPKSRGRNNRKGKRIPKEFINRRTREIIEAQCERFRAKFGRDWNPDDPVFFDPDASEPVPKSAVKIEADMVEAMRKTGTPPQIIYAYKRTGGLLLMEDMREHWPPDRVNEWDDAIEEYFAIEDATKNADRPYPKEWSTEIPEMLASGFDLKRTSRRCGKSWPPLPLSKAGSQ